MKIFLLRGRIFFLLYFTESINPSCQSHVCNCSIAQPWIFPPLKVHTFQFFTSRLSTGMSNHSGSPLGGVHLSVNLHELPLSLVSCVNFQKTFVNFKNTYNKCFRANLIGNVANIVLQRNCTKKWGQYVNFRKNNVIYFTTKKRLVGPLS